MDQLEPRIVILLTCCYQVLKLPEAGLQKAFSALPVSREPRAVYSKQRPAGSVLAKKQSGFTKEVLKKLHCVQNGSPAGVTHLPQAQEATCSKQEGGNGLWIRSHLNFTMVLVVLLALVVALLVSLAAVSARRHRGTPVTPVNPAAQVLLACPHGWVGYRGICYFLSRDHLTWDQAKARCSELGASLAVPKDREMEFLFRLSKKDDYWLGLHRQDQRLQWVDGSNFSSSIKIVGNGECVFLREGKFKSTACTDYLHFLCSRAQTELYLGMEELPSLC